MLRWFTRNRFTVNVLRPSGASVGDGLDLPESRSRVDSRWEPDPVARVTRDPGDFSDGFCESLWDGPLRRSIAMRSAVIGVGIAVAWPGAADAEIRVGLVPPVAIRGSDLIVPLISDDGQDRWPTTIPARIGTRRIDVEVAWIVPRPVEQPRWTTPSTPVSVIASAPEEPRPNGNPIAVVPMPFDGDGEIEMLGTIWSPTWIRADPPFDPEVAITPSIGLDADPPRDDPMEWFRWVIRADLLGGRPPTPVDMGTLGRRVAVAIAAEWRAGLERVATASPGVASEIAERLVATVDDQRRPVGDRLMAAWPTDARGLAGLRAILIDPDRTPMEAARAGLAWFEARPPFVSWVLRPGGGQVVLEIANPTDGEVVALASWTNAVGTSEALVLPPRSLTRHAIDRPRFANGQPPASEEIQIEADGRWQRLLLGSRAIPVRPPGASFGTLGLGRTLAAMEGDFVEAPPTAAGTSAVLRRRDARWEVFIEARCPGRPADEDRVTLAFGEEDRPVAVLEVRADGGFRVEHGLDDGSLEVRTRRIDGAWRAEVTIPEAWLMAAIGRVRAGAVLIGLRRIGPGELVTFAGPPPPAWRRAIPVQGFALGDWGEAPTPPPSADRPDSGP